MMKDLFVRLWRGPLAWIRICAGLAVTASVTSPALAGLTIHVSPSGDDATGDGSGNAPLKTIAAARDAIRSSSANSNMQEDIAVYLHGGRYELTNTLSFTEADSGSNGHFITYQSYPGETAVVSGGKRVTGWSQVPGKSWWSAPVPLSAGFADYFRQIYVNGIRAERARSGWISGVSYFNEPSTPQNIDGITFHAADLKTYTNVTDLRLLHFGSFKVDEFPVVAIRDDPANGLKQIQLQQPYCQIRYNRGEGFFEATEQWMVVNALEELNEPGEWYLDRSARQLYYWPNPSEDMTTARVDAPVVDTLIRVTGASSAAKVRNIRFQGLVLEHGNWLFPRDYYVGGIQAEIIYQSASPGGTTAGIGEMPGQIVLDYTQSIQFLGNTIRHLGSCGIQPRDGASDTLIQGNLFYDTTGAAVLGGRWAANLTDPKPEISSNTVVSNNIIRNTGGDFMGATLIDNLRHQGFRVTHNDMADAPYMGFHQRIDLGTVANAVGIGGTEVSSNKVAMANVGGRYGVGDGGYIYTYGIWPDSIVSGNDIDTINVAGGNVSGFYLDNSSYGVHINGNVMHGVKAGGMGYKFVRSLNDDHTVNSADGNWGDSTVNWFNVVSDPHYHQLTQGQPLPAAAQAIVDAAGLEPAYSGLASRIYRTADLARGKPATASSQWDGNTPPSAAVDWNFGSKWHTASGDPAGWWSVDLGASYVIQRIEISARIDLDQPDARRNFQVQGSNQSDFATFTVLAAQAETPFAWRAVGLSNSWLKHIANPNGFRYLRVIKTVSGTLNFSEFQVHGYPATENPTALSWDAGAEGQRTDGPGSWFAPGQWWNGDSNQGWADGVDVTIGNGKSAAGTIQLNAAADVRTLNFQPTGGGDYTLTGGQISLSGTAPTIFVGVGCRPLIASTIRGTGGFTKTGSGDLDLSGVNFFTGNVTHLTGGKLTLANSGALGTAAKIVVVQGGVSSVALDGTAGDITLPAAIGFQSSGLQSGGCLVSRAGNNSIAGNITLNSGASGTAISVESGTLVIAGSISRVASGIRSLKLQGAGNGNVTGAIASSVNGGLTKDGAGTWTLSGTFAHTGTTNVAGGTLAIRRPGLDNASAVAISATAKLALDFDESAGLVTDEVSTLTIGGQAKPSGTWGAAGSGANFIDNVHFSGPGTLTVASGPVASDYEVWASAAVHGLVGGPDSDDDTDGMTNFEEYAFGLNPKNASSVNPFAIPLESGELTFTYLRRDPALGTSLGYTIWTSLDLKSWALDAGATQAPGTTDGSGVQRVLVTLSAALASAPQLFVRVRAG